MTQTARHKVFVFAKKNDAVVALNDTYLIRCVHGDAGSASKCLQQTRTSPENHSRQLSVLSIQLSRYTHACYIKKTGV